MVRKLSLLLTAAAVLAFAVPAAAHAATGLTEKGALVPKGTIVTFTNVGETTVTSTKTGNITCPSEKVMVEVELTANASTVVEGGPGGKKYTASCTNSTGGVATVTTFVLPLLSTAGGGTGRMGLPLNIELSPGGVTCKYTGIGNTFTYNPTETAEGGSKLTITKQKLSVTPAACGTTAELDGTLKVATGETTTPVYLM